MNCEQAALLDHRAGDLVLHPAAAPGVGAGQDAHGRRVPHRLAHEREQTGFILGRAALPYGAVVEAALDGLAEADLAALPHRLDAREVVEVEGEIDPATGRLRPHRR